MGNLIAVLLALLIAAVIVAVLVAFWAFVLWGACALMNGLARRAPGDPDAIPFPSYPKAMGVVLLIGLAGFLVQAVFVLPTLDFSKLGSNPITPAFAAAALASFPFQLLAAAGLLAWLLPTRYGRGVLLAMLYIGFQCVLNGLMGLAGVAAGIG